MRRAALVLVVLCALTTGCASTAAPPPPGGAADAARVGLTDFAITTRPGEVLSGAVSLAITNAGATQHDLVVRGEEGEWRTPYLRAGETAQLEIQVRAGEQLDLWCSVAGHDAAGMRSVLPVAR